MSILMTSNMDVHSYQPVQRLANLFRMEESNKLKLLKDFKIYIETRHCPGLRFVKILYQGPY